MAPQLANTGKLGKSLDSLITATRVASGQTANNAERSYSNRLMQLGIAPVASGVVRGQVQTAGNREVADLTVRKEEMQQQARKDAALMAAQVAGQIASIRESYSKTLADFNLREATMKQQNNQFNAGTSLDVGKTNIASEASAAELSAKLAIAGVDANGNLIRDPKTGAPITPGGGGGGAGSFYPGYIPSFGPIRPGTGYAHANGNNVFMGHYAGAPAGSLGVSA